MTKQFLLASVLFLGACATDGATPDQSQPVASYTSRTGTTIEIYAEGSSGYSAAEIGDVAHPHLAIGKTDVKTLSASQLYVKTASDTAVPQGLVALDDALVANGRPLSNASVAPKTLVAETLDGCAASDFRAAECPSAGDFPITWCLLNIEGNSGKSFSGVSDSSAALCMKKGGSTYHITNSAGGDHTWTLFEGAFVHYSFSSAIFSTDSLHYEISDAGASTYQFGGDVD